MNIAFNGFRSQLPMSRVWPWRWPIEQCMPLDIKEKGLVFAPSRKDIELDITVNHGRFYRTGKTGE